MSVVRDEIADHMADIGRAAHAAAGVNAIAGFACFVLHDLDGHVVEFERGAIMRCARLPQS